MAKSSRQTREDPIERLLSSKNILDRLDAVELLKKQGNKQRLIELMHSESWHLRNAAKEAVASFGKEVLKEVRPLLEERFWYVRAAALYVIGEIGEPQDFDHLLSGIKSRNRTVRMEASIGMAKMLLRYPALKERLTQEDLTILENNLKEFKEFQLLEQILKPKK